LLFWPAALAGTYAPFLVALFLVGCGSAMLETAANPLMAQFGPPETAAQRLNFAQAFNPPGTIVGVLIGTYFIFSGVELAPGKVTQMQANGLYAGYLHNEIMRVVPTYVGLGAIVLLLAFAISRVTFPQFKTESKSRDDHGNFAEVLCTPHLWLAVVAQFCYCGAQVSTWSAFIPYVKQYTHFSERQAGLLLTANLILMAVGRFASTALMRWFRPSRMMATYALANVFLITVSCLHPGALGALAIILSSLFMSVMYPTIFAFGVRGLGRNTKLGSAMLVMAVIGGGIIPLALGAIARSSGSLARGYIVVVAMYLIVATYGLTQRRDPSLESVDRVPDGI
jgi:FHS family L-fucose permease-like MFS transporter